MAKKYLYPESLEQELEFDKILQQAVAYCYGEPGKLHFQKRLFSSDYDRNQYRLELTYQAKLAYQSGDQLPLFAYENIDHFLSKLAVPGYVLDLEDILQLRTILQLGHRLHKYNDSQTGRLYPLISELISATSFNPQYLLAIQKVLDDQGNVRNDASEELVRIRKSKSAKSGEIEKAFNNLANQYKSGGLLTENVESYRNGRRVLSVPAENKRRIPGIIHDESATGKTVFIEPEPMIALNNDLFELGHLEAREIARIIRDLCDHLRSGTADFTSIQTLISRLDFINAKARIALDYGGELCNTFPEPRLKLFAAMHPLLYLKNRKSGKPVIPFNLTLDQKHRMLLISGPNAGGKSVLMKAVGLLQLMHQSGFLIPVYRESEIGMFRHIFADIGDNQSLDEDLSTYSSHLKSMKYFVDHVGSQSLLLIDEFGGGTDPDIGGVLAESMLTYFNHKHAWGIITTHYSILKLYAHNHPGIFNGSMLFDQQNLQPTYQFKAGSPGSSFAFELARTNGLPDKILNGAEKKLGSKKYKVETLLNDLQREKIEIEKELIKLSQKQKTLDQLINNYQHQMSDVEARKKKIRQEMKEFQLSNTIIESDAIEMKLKELEKNAGIDKIKELARIKKEERLRLAQQVEQLNEEINKTVISKTIHKEIAVGDFVRIKSSGAVGKIIQLKDKQATVEIGELKVNVTVNKLQHERETIDLRKPKLIHTNLSNKEANPASEIDIRGFRRDEALRDIQDFLDTAVINGKMNLRILHGKGDGVLKQLVREFLRNYHIPLNISHPPAESGGDGVTLVQIN